MKKFIRNVTMVAAVVVAFVVTGCEVCAKCTDPSSGYSDEYCGKKPDADAYARTLRNQGWDCTVD